MSNIRKIASVLCLLSLYLFTGCSSSGPATTFYSLFPDNNASATTFDLPTGNDPHANVSLGVGPVVLPDFIDKPAIVGLTNSSAVKVYGYHAWAGDLNETIARVMVEDLSNHLNLESVWAFPWDNRIRPNYQLKVVVENLSGIRGKKVELLLKWTLLNKTADKILASGKERLTKATRDGSINTYVGTMNDLINSVSTTIAEKIAAQLVSN